MTTASPAWALEQATVAAINADAQIVAAGAAMFQLGSVPASRKAPHITSGEASERRVQRTFDAPGHDSVRTWHVWASTKEQALALYEHIARVLETTTISLTGHTVRWADCELVTVLRDPGGLIHAVVRVQVETVRA